MTSARTLPDGLESTEAPASPPRLRRALYLAQPFQEIVELDLNPLFALPPGQGCQIADARIRVEPARATG